MPEIKAIVNNFADDIIKDVEGKVAQDDWVRVKCAQSEVVLPKRTLQSAAASMSKKPQAEPEVVLPKKTGSHVSCSHCTYC